MIRPQNSFWKLSRPKNSPLWHQKGKETPKFWQVGQLVSRWGGGGIFPNSFLSRRHLSPPRRNEIWKRWRRSRSSGWRRDIDNMRREQEIIVVTLSGLNNRIMNQSCSWSCCWTHILDDSKVVIDRRHLVTWNRVVDKWNVRNEGASIDFKLLLLLSIHWLLLLFFHPIVIGLFQHTPDWCH